MVGLQILKLFFLQYLKIYILYKERTLYVFNIKLNFNATCDFDYFLALKKK